MICYLICYKISYGKLRSIHPKIIFFTDLDGTVLDLESYSYEHSLSALNELKKHDIPIIFCSHKTRAEQLVLRKEIGVDDPFIVENGGAIFIPKGYFNFRFDYQKESDDFIVIELGKSYEYIQSTLQKIETSFDVSLRGFSDMSVEEIAIDSGLSYECAKLAKKREYGETLIIQGTKENIERLLKSIENVGLKWTHGGRYFSVTAGNDKGAAVELLMNLFRKKYSYIKAIGVGDSLNDVPMFENVDESFLVQKSGGLWDDISVNNMTKIDEVGPKGFQKAVYIVLNAL